MTQKIFATLHKCAFLTLDVQLVLAQLLKDRMQVINMLTCGLTVYVHSDILVEHIREHIVHQALKYSWSVCQT